MVLAGAGVLVAAGLVNGIATAGHGDVSLAGSSFEIDSDANLKVDHAAPSLDWANVSEERKADKPTGATDDSFTQGAKEDTAVPVIETGSIPPNKSDLLNFGVYLEEAATTDFLHVFWHRVQEPSGTTNMDFEFNKSEAISANGVTPVRSPGDVLIQYDLANGGVNPELFLSRWITGSNGETKADCEASTKLPCWDDRINLSQAGDATGSINTSAIPAAEADGLGGISARTFGEASIDFSTLTSGDQCVAFGSAYLKSRSSDSFTAAMKDFIAPEPLNISNCGSIKVIKTDDDDPATNLDGATFDLVADAAPIGGAPGPEDTEVIDSCTSGEGSNPTGECLFVEVFAGNYWVIETAAPPGHDLADPPYQSVTVTADEEVSVTFVNPRQRGAVLVTKTRKHAADGSGDHPHAGVTFTLDDADGNTVSSGVTDANGEVCFDGLLLGSYSVTETVPDGYVAEGDTTKSVDVTQASSCGDGDEAAASFGNMPLTDLSVSVDSQVDGGTASTIECTDEADGTVASGSTNPAGDGSASATDLVPGTYTCIVFIDP